MSDGRIVIDILANAKGLEQARKSIQEVEKDITEATSADFDDPFDKLGKGADNAIPKIAGIAKAIGIAQLGLKALNMVIGSIGGAVKRFDTLNQFPKVMEQMGFGAKESKESIDRLKDGIQGLPTTLDAVVSTTQRFATAFRDVDKATETTLALNNALLASGANQDEASRSTDQYVKMLSSGKVEMDAWNTLSETMNFALTEVSGSLGYSTENTWELYSALKNGEVTLDDFNTALIEASTTQGGFAEIALTSSEGLGTSWQNIQTAIVNGVSSMITALDDLVEELTGSGIAYHLDRVKNSVNIAFRTMSTVLRSSTPLVEATVKIFNKMVEAIRPLTPLITGVVAAYGTMKILSTVSTWMGVVEKAVWALTVSKGSLTTATKMMTANDIVATTAQKVLAGAYAILTGQIGLATIAKKAFAAASAFVTTPIGAIVTAIGLGVGAFMLFKDSIFKVNEETAAFVEEAAAVSEAAGEMATNSKESTEAFENQRTEIDKNEQSLLDLVGMLEEVTKKEETSTAERETALGVVSQLNKQLDGLNLVYDAETNSINLSTEALKENIKQRADLERNAQQVDRLIELDLDTRDVKKQLEEVEQTLDAVRAKREELNSSGGNWGEKRAVTEELDTLKGVYSELTTLIVNNESEMATLEGSIIQYTESIATATEESAERQTVAFSDLNDSQKEVITDLQAMFQEYEEVATNAMSKISTESEIGANTMLENVRHNQQAVVDLTDNLSEIEAKANELGSSGHFLEYLRELGPQAAGEIANLAGQLDTQAFTDLVTEIDGAGALAAESMEKLTTNLELPEGALDFITDIKGTLEERISESGLSEVGVLIKDEVAIGLEESNETLTAAGENIPQSVADSIKDKSEVAKTAGTDLGSTIDGAFADALGIASPSKVFLQHGINTVLGAIKGVSDTENQLTSRVKELADKTVNKFNEAVPKFEEAGKNAGRGFNNGLESMRSTISETARSIARTAAQTINRELRIESPSKVTYQSGQDTVEGLELGMLSGMKDIEAASRKLVSATLPTLDLGRQYTNNYMRNNVQNVITNYGSAPYTRDISTQTKENSKLLERMTALMYEMTDSNQRILEKDSVVRSYLDSREVTKELHDPMNDYREMQEFRKSMLKGTW